MILTEMKPEITGHHLATSPSCQVAGWSCGAKSPIPIGKEPDDDFDDDDGNDDDDDNDGS